MSIPMEKLSGAQEIKDIEVLFEEKILNYLNERKGHAVPFKELVNIISGELADGWPYVLGKYLLINMTMRFVKEGKITALEYSGTLLFTVK